MIDCELKMFSLAPCSKLRILETGDSEMDSLLKKINIK